jgi:hypothetical protein
MTIYEPNPEVRPTGAEIDEFVDVPEQETVLPPKPDRPSQEATRDESEEETCG